MSRPSRYPGSRGVSEFLLAGPAMPTRMGATAQLRWRAWTATSKRTWSLPLPVQPWATASPLAVGDLDQQLGDERPGERRGHG